MEGVRILSRKSKNVNFRTATHNALLASDDQYDARYHATVLSQSKVWSLYQTVMGSLMSEALENLRNSFIEFQSQKTNLSSRIFVLLSGRYIYIAFFCYYQNIFIPSTFLQDGAQRTEIIL